MKMFKASDIILTPAGIRGKLIKRQRNPSDGQIYWLVQVNNKFDIYRTLYREDEIMLAPK